MHDTDFRWTGRQGEKAFGLKCSHEKVTCNKAEEDDCGWDFIVQFQPTSLIQVPTDQREAGACALVQVKATEVDAVRWRISLKNALNLAHSSLPAFIVRVGLDIEGQNRFRAIHIWGPQIERILTAARRSYVEGDEAIHKRLVSFELGPETDRTDLLQWMQREIGAAGGRSYAAVKQSFVEKIGFEDETGIAKMRLSLPSPDALLDLQLGLIEPLPINYFSFTPSRFGIPTPSPEVEFHSGTVEILPVGRITTLKLRAPDARQVFLPAQIFSATLPGHKSIKVRIKAGGLDIVMKSRKKVTVTHSLKNDEAVSLDTLAALALLRRSQRNTPIQLSLKEGNIWHDFGHVNMNNLDFDFWNQMFINIYAIKKIFTFENSDFPITTLNILRSSFASLSILEALINDRHFRIEYTPHHNDSDGDQKPEQKPIIFLSYTHLKIGNLEIGAVATRSVVQDRMISKRRCLDMGPATILHASINNGTREKLHSLYLDELDRLSSIYDVLAVGDLMDCVSDDNPNRELTLDQPRSQILRGGC